MRALKDILGQREQAEPEEVKLIKKYVRERFQADVGVTTQDKVIIISVAGAGLAGSLRPHLHLMREICQTDKRLVIRIGS